MLPFNCRTVIFMICLLLTFVPIAQGADKARARDLGVPFEGQPGTLNAITDVAGIEVGHVTLIKGDGLLQVGTGPVRTGVTVITCRQLKNKAAADLQTGRSRQLRHHQIDTACLRQCGHRACTKP